jgi:hypothetical protein
MIDLLLVAALALNATPIQASPSNQRRSLRPQRALTRRSPS